MRSWRAASRPRRAAPLLARWRTRRCPGLTISRRRLTSTLGSPGAGSTTTVRSSTAVTQTRCPSTSASKSGRISSSSSISTVSRRTSSIWLLDPLVCFRFESMLISQIPDQEQDQTQRQPWNQVRWKYKECFPNPWPHPPAQFEEDRCPDQCRHKYARCENPIRDPEYSRKSRKHDPHAGYMPADDDRPRPPAFVNALSPQQPFVGYAQISAETLNERATVTPADGEVACAAQDGA